MCIQCVCVCASPLTRISYSSAESPSTLIVSYYIMSTRCRSAAPFLCEVHTYTHIHTIPTCVLCADVLVNFHMDSIHTYLAMYLYH